MRQPPTHRHPAHAGRRTRLAWACAAVCATALCATALPAHAQDAVWNGGTGSWADATGWSVFMPTPVD
jgi:hypothetical protein